MDAERLSGVLRSVRASNYRKSVGAFHIVFFGNQDLLVMANNSATQEQYTVEKAYFAYTAIQTQGVFSMLNCTHSFQPVDVVFSFTC